MASDHKTKAAPMGSPYERWEYPARDANLENLINNWEHNGSKLIIFLGAGASIGGKARDGRPFPKAYELRNELWSRFMLKPHEREAFDFADLGLMTLEGASAIVTARVNRRALEEFLAERFTAQKPLWPHAVLPFLAPRAILTTNYDDLIEQGWNASGVARRCATVWDTQAANPSYMPLYKPHGTVEQPHAEIEAGGLVISQFDYFRIIARRQRMLDSFMSDFNQSCVLFIGYSFHDMDISAHLHRVRRERRGPKWYAVFPRDDDDVRRMYEQEYGILQINRTFHDFMADLDAEVNFIPRDWKRDRVARLVKAGKIAGPAPAI
jgi:hypothetical protein